ncbi:MAG: sensor histidine kinase [Clostridiales bacterium]|nr:sensor histidine kinase [Clostridiales bacterium]MDO4350890.1 sensor histidine kinase [Eubacteriales bacterium]MDY4008907.1 sensor histidine kinase [Candidatus Limiplasma sp.]
MNKRSLRFQMVMVLLMLILTMTAFGRIMCKYFEQQYSAKLLKINSDVTYQLADSIATQYASLKQAQDSFCVNTTVNRFLSTDSEYEKLTLVSLYESLQQAYKKMFPSLYSIVLKRKDGSIFSDPSGTSEINIAHTAPAFRELEAGAESVLIISGNKAFVAMKQDVYQSGGIRQKAGSCLFVILAERLMGGLQAQSAESREIFIIDSQRRVVAHNGACAIGSELPQPYAAYLGKGEEKPQQIQDKDYIIVSHYIPSIHWTALCITPKSAVFSELKGIQYTSYLLLLMMLLIVSTVYLMQGLSLSRAFHRFISHINAIADGKQVQPLKLHYSLEFHQLAEAFNRMMCRLEELNAHNLEYHEKILMQDIENKQSQLLALQSQINPHFLYNTLECINSAGALCGSREVEDMSTALAFIFRYAIKGENLVRLQDELETLQYYLSIQQIRFPNRFSVQYEIPDELKTRSMLKFLLQPIVENSIQHGFGERTSSCVLRIGVTEKEKRLIVRIEDNGMGIEPGELRALQSSLEAPTSASTSIGLMNIQRRIRLYYGGAFGLRIQSQWGEGTAITAILPVLDGE